MHILWLIKAIDLKLMFIMSKKKKKRCRSNNKTLHVQYRKRKFNYMGPPPSSAHLGYYNSQIWPIFPNPPYDLGPRLVSSLFPPQKRGREGGRRRRREGREGEIAGSPPAAATMSSMLSAFSQWFVNPRRNPLARLHMQAISSRLRKYGRVCCLAWIWVSRFGGVGGFLDLEI